MKMLNFVIFVKKKIKNKCLKDTKYQKNRNHCHYTEEHRGTAHSISNLKCSVPKEISIFFHNASMIIILSLQKNLKNNSLV